MPEVLPSAREMIDDAERMNLPTAKRQDGFRRAAANHTRQAAAARGEKKASAERQADYHLTQAAALIAEADSHEVDFSQVVDTGGTQPEGREANVNRSETRRTADEAIKRNQTNGMLSDKGAEMVTQLMERGHPGDQQLAQRWVAAAGDEAYARAFGKMVIDPANGSLSWTNEEHDAWRRASEVRGWLEGTPTSAGYLVPLSLDPAVMLTNAGVRSPLRSVARVEQILTDSWRGITSAGTTAEWVPEAQQVAEMTPTVGVPAIPVHKLSVFTRFSLEIAQDGLRVVDNLQEIMFDAALTEMEGKYATGDGIAVPEGIVTGLAAVAASVIAPTVAESYTKADPYKVQNDLGPRFQQNASWLADLAIINATAQFETTSGALQFPEVGSDRLLRKSLREMSTLDGDYNAAVTANNYVLIYGDIRKAFVIVDRIGASLEVIPHLFGAAGRPTGERLRGHRACLRGRAPAQ